MKVLVLAVLGLAIFGNFVHCQMNNITDSGQTNFYLDMYSQCDGRPREVGNSTVFIRGQSTELQGQPVSSCAVTLKTTVSYRFKLQVISVHIDDPGVHFYIYDGDFQGRLLGSFSKLEGKPPSLNFIFTSGHLVTFRLTRGELERNFDLRIVVTPVPSSLPFYLDRYSDCDGRPIEVGNSTVFISGQSTELQGQPVSSCTVTLKTTNRVPYRFKLQVISVRIDDPGVHFYIHAGEFQGRLLGSFSKLHGKPPSLNFIFTSGHLVTFRLTRGELEGNFDIRILVTPVPSSLPYPSDNCMNCTKCREEYLVDGELSPDCPESCKNDQMDNDFMKRCGTTVLCAKKEGVQKCACTQQACTSGSHILKLPFYLLLSFLVAILSLKYLV